MIVSAVFGGIGTVMGPIIGGFLFTLLMEALWASFPYIYLIILGVSLVLVMRFIPNGIIERLAQIGRLMRRFGV
jgi:branched-chain amino acid transport system permease protein